MSKHQTTMGVISSERVGTGCNDPKCRHKTALGTCGLKFIVHIDGRCITPNKYGPPETARPVALKEGVKPILPKGENPLDPDLVMCPLCRQEISVMDGSIKNVRYVTKNGRRLPVHGVCPIVVIESANEFVPVCKKEISGSGS